MPPDVHSGLTLLNSAPDISTPERDCLYCRLRYRDARWLRILWMRVRLSVPCPDLGWRMASQASPAQMAVQAMTAAAWRRRSGESAALRPDRSAARVQMPRRG